jgi:hypothetical protein
VIAVCLIVAVLLVLVEASAWLLEKRSRDYPTPPEDARLSELWEEISDGR